ncbi:LysR family transcriptional regulator [Steroidobacter flavus]|uniref:LysR family transcriptional regulator n=1 Tax=Steroidobacter flavus TaxID=1842136 RepID=A0ABV8T1P6_9GAMM
MHRSGIVELEAVLAVARRRSFRAAATELGMSTTALSSAVAGLEARLGVRLFNRTTRSVALTEAGESFVGRIAPAMNEINGAMDALNTHRQNPAGTLRINTPAGAAHMAFAPIVLEYVRRYPEVNVDIVTEARMVDIVAAGFDAGIRIGELVPKDMIAVPMGPELRMTVVGSPEYFAKHPRPRQPLDLLSHTCIRYRLPGGRLYRWEFERGDEALNLDVPGALTLDEPTLIREAALAGVGLAILTDWFMRDDLAAGRLIPVLSEWMQPFPGISLYYPANRHVPTALRLLIDLIHEVVNREKPRRLKRPAVAVRTVTGASRSRRR